MKKLIFTLIAVTACSLLHAQQNAYSWDNLPKVSRPVFKKDTFNVAIYQAKNAGSELSTASIQQAINDCNRKGGGTVLIPEGIWTSGPLYFKSNVNLHLNRGAMLIFTSDKNQYKLVRGDYEGKSAARNESPINGSDLENIAITGQGIIDGNGDVWRAVNQSQLTAAQWKNKIASGGVLSDEGKTWYPSEQFKETQQKGKSMLIAPGQDLQSFKAIKDFLRPNLLVLKNCSKVLLEGVTFQNSAAWCLHPILCEDMTISGIRVKNPEYAQNGDGIDIESCKRFIVENSLLDVGDDAICIKSGKDEEGRKRGKPTAEGIIRGNTVYSGHGGVVIGSEMSGGANNIFIENCTFIGTDKGLRFKSTRGRGGVVENIFARNIVMKDIGAEAIFFDMYYFVKFATDGTRDESPVVNEGTPVFRHMVFDNIACEGAKIAVFIRGLPEMKVEDITISNSKFTAAAGLSLTDAAGITFDHVELKVQQKASSAALSLAKAMAATIMHKWPDSLSNTPGKPVVWSYDLGVFFDGMARIYEQEKDPKYISYMQHIMDLFIREDGTINRYKATDYNIDHIKNGRTLLFLYRVTGQQKYRMAAASLRKQLLKHPRTEEGGFWHKKVYPHQMWLDGIYMGQPFYAEWSSTFKENNYNDIAKQFILLEKHARDEKTGLLYHGWDESKAQQWADKTSGHSPNFWGRAMGWYGMALVDVLDNFPQQHPQRAALIAILQRYVAAVAKVQHPENGIWYQVLDKSDVKGNYPEASASSMFVYTLAKALNKNYIGKKYLPVAEKGFNGIQKQFLSFDSRGDVHLNRTVQVSGLGGTPYRSGSVDYYLSEPVITDDAKGMGAFILCAAEMNRVKR